MKKIYLLTLISAAFTLGAFIGYFIGKDDCNSCGKTISQKEYSAKPYGLNGEVIENGNACWHYCLGNNDSSITSIDSDEAKTAIWNYGHWAGRMACEIEQYYKCMDTAYDKHVELAAGWTIPLNELLADLNGASHARAYIGIKNVPIFQNNSSQPLDTELPEVELILAVVDNADSESSGNDRISEKYHNLVRPCPNLCDTNSPLYKSFKEGETVGRMGQPNNPCQVTSQND